MHVIDETPPPVDLHNRDPLAVRSFKFGIAVDRHLTQLEAEIVLRSRDDAPGSGTEVAARCSEEDDVDYG
jgi:hypothetical protein